jgi:thioredoxin
MAVVRADTPLLAATSDELAALLETTQPVLLLIWQGDTLRTDLRNELDKVAREQAGRIFVVKADTSRAPEIAAHFEVGSQSTSILLAYHNGQVLARRNRPWATDVQPMVEMLLPLAAAAPAVPQTIVDKPVIYNKPVKVTDATFKQEVIESETPVVVDFWATWCGPCLQVAPIFDKLAAAFAGRVKVAKVDVDENPGVAQAFRIQSIPTIMFVKGGKIVGQQVGALPEVTLRGAFEQLVALTV